MAPVVLDLPVARAERAAQDRQLPTSGRTNAATRELLEALQPLARKAEPGALQTLGRLGRPVAKVELVTQAALLRSVQLQTTQRSTLPALQELRAAEVLPVELVVLVTQAELAEAADQGSTAELAEELPRPVTVEPVAVAETAAEDLEVEPVEPVAKVRSVVQVLRELRQATVLSAMLERSVALVTPEASASSVKQALSA